MTRLTEDNINQHVVAAKYAVRGELAVKSEEYRAKIARGEGGDLPFDHVISANIGNPQQLDQKPITFFRQVASILENPQLLQKEEDLINVLGYKTDVIERAKFLLSKIGSVGAYSASTGVPAIRESVAKFLEREYSLASTFHVLMRAIWDQLRQLRSFQAHCAASSPTRLCYSRRLTGYSNRS
jgi:alanine transaminase